MKQGFVLNDYLLAAIPPPQRRHFESTYLIFREPVEAVEIRKPKEEVWIGIPGEVDFRRRDYEGLFKELSAHGTLDARVRFILLGRCRSADGDGRELFRLIAGSGLRDQFTLFDAFVAPGEFFGYLERCDALLPLIHPASQFFEFYRSHQVSGTYNLAFGFAKPLVLHEALKGPEDFETSAFFYGPGTLTSRLNDLVGDRGAIAACVDRIRSCPKFSFEYQSAKYLRNLTR